MNKEGTLFTGERGNAFYETLLSSKESISETVKDYKADQVEKSYASNSLLLYRLLDVINFAHNDKGANAAVPRQSFPMLLIPVCLLSSYS